MVRFWPFGGRDDNSPDSFERILVKLSSQIKSTSTKLAVLRQRSRRYKALFTIYSVIGYILYCIVVVLVVGYQNVGLHESGGLIGGPLGIYVVRRLLNLYYGRRIASTEARLEDFQMKQRATIEKLKAATKYSTTQSLIEKYGGTASGASSPKQENKRTPSAPRTPRRHSSQSLQRQQQPPQTGAMLTPDQIRVQQQLFAQQEAGIPPRFGHGLPSPRSQSPKVAQLQPSPLQPALHMQGQTQPPSQQHLRPEEATAPKWYDRIMDVVLGEDETSAKNRFALICRNCRMVNGLAPPGTRTLDDMDRWGCARCGTMNGGRKNSAMILDVKQPESQQYSESEASHYDSEPKLVTSKMTHNRAKREESVTTDDDHHDETDDEVVKQESDEGDDNELQTPKPKSKAKAKGRKKT